MEQWLVSCSEYATYLLHSYTVKIQIYIEQMQTETWCAEIIQFIDILGNLIRDEVPKTTNRYNVCRVCHKHVW